MAYLFAAFIVFFNLFAYESVGAALMERPKVEYSADETMQTEDMSIQQKVFYTPTRERKEMVGSSMGADGGEMIQIYRYDNKVMWQLIPSQKMYMEHAFGKMDKRQATQDLSRWSFEETAVGEEVMDGMKVTKYKTIATSTDGKKFGGFSWRTKEGIPLKMDLLFKEGDEKKRMMTELKNVKVGKQDPSLFEIPQGFTKFDMAGMMGGMMGGSGMGREGMGRRQMSPPPSDQSSESMPPIQDKSEVEKAGEMMMKKMFGR